MRNLRRVVRSAGWSGRLGDLSHMKTRSTSLTGAVFAAIALITSLPAMGAVLWVDGVLAMPTTYTGTAQDFVTKITDQSNATAVTGIALEGTDTLTLGWSTPFTNDGTGIIKITSTVNLFPQASASGYDIRLLLEDNSYSNTYTVSVSTGVKEIDFVIRAYVSRQTVLIDDIYSGPGGERHRVHQPESNGYGRA